MNRGRLHIYCPRTVTFGSARKYAPTTWLFQRHTGIFEWGVLSLAELLRMEMLMTISLPPLQCGHALVIGRARQTSSPVSNGTPGGTITHLCPRKGKAAGGRCYNSGPRVVLQNVGAYHSAAVVPSRQPVARSNISAWTMVPRQMVTLA